MSGSFECVMECMCAQTRPQFILSFKRVLGGNGERIHVNSFRTADETFSFSVSSPAPADEKLSFLTGT